MSPLSVVVFPVEVCKSCSGRGVHETADVFLMTFQSALLILERYLEDLSDADIGKRPSPHANPVAYQLGHLVVSGQQMIAMLSPHALKPLASDFVAAYAKENAGKDDTGRFHTKAEYLSHFRAQGEALRSVVATMSESNFDEPGPEKTRSYLPTKGSIANMLGVHILMHLGQIAVLRRELGKPVVI